MPGSAEAALAVKTERFPLRAAPHYGNARALLTASFDPLRSETGNEVANVATSEPERTYLADESLVASWVGLELEHNLLA